MPFLAPASHLQWLCVCILIHVSITHGLVPFTESSICLFVCLFVFDDEDHFKFIEFVTLLFLCYILFFWLRGMWDLSSLIRE